MMLNGWFRFKSMMTLAEFCVSFSRPNDDELFLLLVSPFD
jgi:hypothetical protein